jgi:hypothetical protein
MRRRRAEDGGASAQRNCGRRRRLGMDEPENENTIVYEARIWSGLVRIMHTNLHFQFVRLSQSSLLSAVVEVKLVVCRRAPILELRWCLYLFSCLHLHLRLYWMHHWLVAPLSVFHSIPNKSSCSKIYKLLFNFVASFLKRQWSWVN